MTWDEQYERLLADLVANGEPILTTRRGVTKELLGYQFMLENPRDRIVFNTGREFNLFQTIGQWLWMLSGRSDFGFVHYYNQKAREFSADLRQVEGAYGPRLFGVGAHMQIPRCIEMLKERPASRQVMAIVYDATLDAHRRDQEGRKGEVPCTISMQFIQRGDKLHCITNMRSQEAVGLLPQDVFHFTLFQEYVAASIGANLGTYRHHAGSLHYYESRTKLPSHIIGQSHGFRANMPPMPIGDQMPHLLKVLELEERIRVNAQDFKAQKGRRTLDSKQHWREAEKLPHFWRSIIHACIGQAAMYTEEKPILKEYVEQVDEWLRPTFRKAFELKGGERLLDNYGLVPDV
jgi:thymidylate synthase